jgi:hypothetical protein
MKPRPCTREETFNRLLLEVVDETLCCMGATARESIYFHLANNFNIKKVEIPHKVEECASAIRAIFGLAAFPLETLIMKQLYKKIRCVVECSPPENFEMSAYVEMLRSSFLSGATDNITFVPIADENVDYSRLIKV